MSETIRGTAVRHATNLLAVALCISFLVPLESRALATAGSTIAARGAGGLADDALGLAGRSRGAPDFVVTPGGEAIPVPTGATGPYPTGAPGFQYLEGSGGPGLDPRVTGVRVMDANANQGPRAVYMNRTGQTVDPATGRTLPNKDPRAHQYLLPWE